MSDALVLALSSDPGIDLEPIYGDILSLSGNDAGVAVRS